MRLTVNGVVVRVVDRIEIEMDVHREGEELPGGIQIRCRGGPLTVRQGPDREASLEVETDRTLDFRGRDAGALLRSSDPTNRFFVADRGAGKFTCHDGQEPAISFTAEG